MYFNDLSRWFTGEGDGRGRGPGGPGGPGGRHGRGGGGPGGPFGAGRGGRGRGFGGDWQDMFRDRPQRAERGGVRYLVLDAIRETPRHGYEIMGVIGERTGGAYKPSPGVIYPTLQLLEELGHVKVTELEGKKVYAITPAGTSDLSEHREEVASFYEQSEDVFVDHGEVLHDFIHRMRGLMRGFRRAARRGRLTPEAWGQIRAILDDAAGKLEAIIGRDDAI